MTAITIKNPIQNSILYKMQETNPQEIGTIYAKAQAAFETVRNLSIKARLQECAKIQQFIIENRELIIDRIVQENGKTRFDCLCNEIFTVLSVLDYYRKNAVHILKDKKLSTPQVLFGKKSRIVYEPLGPVLIISPWNYPLYQSLVPILSAFIAGNSIIFKPSEITPLYGFIEDILEKTGFPQDAIQVVYGEAETGKKLIEAKPAKIFFTGSLETGKKIMALAAQHVIPVDLELGGKDPMIVFDDVNLEKAVNGALWGAFTNCGQACISVERLYVQRSIYPAFINSLQDKIARLKMNDGSACDTPANPLDLGAMTTERQVAVADDHVKDAVAKGAKVLAGGEKNKHPFLIPQHCLSMSIMP